MSFSNDTKASTTFANETKASTSFSNSSKNSSSYSTDTKAPESDSTTAIAAGESMGLLLALTYAVAQSATIVSRYTNDLKASTSFSNETKH